MPKYTTKTKVQTFLGTTITDDIDEIIDGVEKYIDNYTERDFVADSSASARTFNGDNSQTLMIDDAIEITKVELGNDQHGDNFTEKTLDTDYKLLPANYSALGVPVYQIYMRNEVFGSGIQNHRITAKWGYSEEAPADIIWVATFLAGAIYQTGQGGNLGGVSSERIGEYSVNFKTEKEFSDFKKSKELLDNYKRYYL